MSGNLHPIRTKETLISGFESPPPPVVGELNLRELLRTWEHCRNCAQTTETDFDAQNFLTHMTQANPPPTTTVRVQPTTPPSETCGHSR